MPSARLVLAVAALAAGARLGADARVNASGAIEVFLISDCAECTTDKDSVYCSDSTSDDNFVSNGTLKVTTAQKKSSNPPYGVGPSAGSHFCWAGTFGQLLYANGNYPSLLNSNNVTAKLGCDSQNLFYRQCVIPTQLAIILMSFAALICVCCTTCVCFYCSCCKCLNNKGDESRFGMCNRFCPFMPCADPPEKEDVIHGSLVNPLSEEENKSSLFGRNKELNTVVKPKSLAAIKKPGAPASPGMTAREAPPEDDEGLANFKKAKMRVSDERV